MVVVDRIEAGVAVLEGSMGMLSVPVSWLPAGAGEGSVLQVEVRREAETSLIGITLDPDARAAREAEIRRLRDAIPDGPGGDILL
jgi:hypothetical protein